MGHTSLKFFHHNSNSMEISIPSHINSNVVIATKLCTWHNSYAVMAYEKFCWNLMTMNWVTTKWNFHQTYIVNIKSLVNWFINFPFILAMTHMILCSIEPRHNETKLNRLMTSMWYDMISQWREIPARLQQNSFNQFMCFPSIHVSSDQTGFQINPSGAETGIFWDNKVYTMVVDDLAPCIARSSVTKISTIFPQKDLNYLQHLRVLL